MQVEFIILITKQILGTDSIQEGTIFLQIIDKLFILVNQGLKLLIFRILCFLIVFKDILNTILEGRDFIQKDCNQVIEHLSFILNKGLRKMITTKIFQPKFQPSFAASLHFFQVLLINSHKPQILVQNIILYRLTGFI